jgi:ATP-dependent DNA ligase
MGGEGIVLKERTSLYRPGVRSPAWLKLKPKLTLDVVVTGRSADRVRWGDWGEAVMLAFRYSHGSLDRSVVTGGAQQPNATWLAPGIGALGESHQPASVP